MHPLSRRETLRLSALAGAACLFRPLFVHAEEIPAGPAAVVPPPAPVPTTAADWAARAELAERSLHDRHWDDAASLYHSRLPVNPNDQVFDYWWQAHALDLLVDRYERTKDKTHLERAKRLFHGIIKRNGHKLINDYYDDMSWLAIALQRLHAHDPDAAVQKGILELWADIRSGWTDLHGGGISWSKKKADYKSVPSNAPPVILAVRLHRTAKNPADLEIAVKLHAWMMKTLVDPDTGLIWDGIHRAESVTADNRAIYSYNQGTFLEASLELFRATGKQEYLDTALRTATAAEAKLVDENGVMREGGRGDGGLFKGILVRYLGDLALHEGAKDPAHAAFLVRNAEAAWKNAVNPEQPAFGGSWRGPDRRGGTPGELCTQLSAVMLLEQVAAISAKS